VPTYPCSQPPRAAPQTGQRDLTRRERPAAPHADTDTDARRDHDAYIEATVTIRPDSTLTVQVPRICAGDHHIVVIIDEQPTVEAPRPPLQFAAYPVGLTCT